MKHQGYVLVGITCLAVFLISCQQQTYDIVIYGGTSAGVQAAVQASRMGNSVVLICPETRLGGMTSNGLGWTDSGNTDVVGGLAREFYHRIWREYQDQRAWRWQSKESYGNEGQGSPAMDGAERTMWVFEPHVAERVFEELIEEHQVPVKRNRWLDREAGVIRSGTSIRSIRTLSGEVFRGRIFIDATYEGDLMATAGINYHLGREANAVYAETWNGVQKDARHHRHHFDKPIDPYIEPGNPASGLLPLISSEELGENGEGDHRIQAYCFRLCLTRLNENRVPFSQPEGYDSKQYELLLRVLDSGWRELFDKFDPVPNLKTDTNNHGPFSSDNIGQNYEYPEATYERRAEIIREHERYQRGLLYFLANDPKVPEDVRLSMSEWGLAKDEFTDSNHWPRQIYVREARRLIGEYVMTEHDCLSLRETPEPVGMGSYTMDSHNVQRYVTSKGFVQNEGDIGVHPNEPYQISYRSLLPRAEQCSNLLVPVCLSSSHIAYGSIRMEPVFMILGQSAATAASLALNEGVSLHELDYSLLRTRLLKDKQILEWTSNSESY